MLDTLSIARDLRAAELPPEQAEAIAAAIGRAVVEESASKADLALVEAKLQGEIERLEGKIEQFRASLEARIESVRNQIVLWVVGSQVTLAGLIIAVIKL